MKTLKQKLAVVLSALLVFCVAGIPAGASGTGNAAPVSNGTAVTPSEPVADTVSAETAGVSKDETVYVLATADGSVRKIIVSDWLKNADSSDTIADNTSLDNVTNIKGDETYTLSGDHARVWDAKGNDIYYQGTTDQSLPVGVTVSYLLDGKSVSAEELAGKSGRVTIRYDYVNNEYRQTDINGVETKIYVPFVMLTGLAMDNNHFRNIEVSNGRIINDGDRTFVMGFALPGLQANLGLASDEIKIPNFVEITADATDFALETAFTYASGDLFGELDLNNIQEIDDLTDSMGKLSDAMARLTDGSSALYDGLTTLLDKSNDLLSGIDQLAAGASRLKTGAQDLETGAANVRDGIQQLSGGLQALDANSSSLTDGAKQVFASLLSTADSALAAAGVQAEPLTIDNYADVLNGLGASMSEDDLRAAARSKALEVVTAAVRAQEPAIRTQVEEAIHVQVTEKVISAALNITPEAYTAAVSAGQIPQATQTQITAAVQQQMQTDEIQAAITANTEAQIQKLIDAQMESPDVAAQIEAGVQSSRSQIGRLAALKAQLDSYNQFYQGLCTYTSGVRSACDGSEALASGSAELASGAGSLAEGAGSLSDGLSALQTGGKSLTDGVSQLKDGAMQLNDGLVQFNEEGVQKLLDAFGGDFTDLVARLRASADVSKAYNSFAGISDGMAGSVKFIYRTDSIGQ